MIDDAIGEIVQAVEASGQLENTVFCVTADHGDYLGDVNLLLKGKAAGLRNHLPRTVHLL